MTTSDIAGCLGKGVVWLNRAGGVIAALAIAAMTVLICLEVVLRKLFNTSTMMSDEMAGYLLVAASFLALGYTLDKEGHVQVESIVQRLPGTVRGRLSLGWHLIALVYVAVLLYRSSQMVLDSYRLGATAVTVMETPLYLPQALVPLGLLLMLLLIFVRICLSVLRTRK